MVFDKSETIEIETLKHSHKIEFENLRHKNRIEELKLELEIAVKNGGGADK